MSRKVTTNEDRVRNGGILDKDGFLRQHNDSEVAKKTIKAFEDAKLLKLVTFDHGGIHKKKVIDFYPNATVPGDGSIKSKVNDIEVIITADDIREEFEMEAESDLDVSSHAFDQRKF